MVKRVLIATGTFFPEVSGQSTFVYNLIKNLEGSGLEISVVSYGDKENYVQYLGDGQADCRTEIHFAAKNSFRHLSYFLKIRRLGKKADIIFAQDLFSSGLPAALGKRRKQKLMVRIGGDFLWEKMVNSGRLSLPLSKYYQQPKSLKEKIYLFFFNFVINRSHKLIFNTAWQRDIYKNYFNFPPKKTSVVENPWEKKYRETGEESDSDEIIFAGRFIELKNLRRLIRSFRRVNTEKKLILIGSGPQKEALMAAAAGDQRIIFEDNVSSSILMSRLARAYLAVLPSLSEVNPNLAMEALSLGIPCILTAEVGIREELKKYFKLIDPASEKDIQAAIENMLNKENHQNTKSLMAKMQSDYGWQEVADDYLKIFKES